MRNGQNRNSGRGRYRRMYELTGIPGWIRFGSSPGFAGGGAGRGPCAEYLDKTGQLPAFLKELSEKNPNYDLWNNTMMNLAKRNPEQQKEELIRRIRDLEDELKYLKKELKELR